MRSVRRFHYIERLLKKALLVACLLLFGRSECFAQETQPIGVELLGGSLEVRLEGGLDFGNRVLTGRNQEVTALSAPIVEIIDCRGSGQGWHLTFELSDLQSPQGANLRAENVSYTASGGSVVVLDGLPLTAGGPLETGSSQSLEIPQRVLVSAPESGMGTYRWLPNPERFRFVIPATALAGNYRGTLTVTIASGL